MDGKGSLDCPNCGMTVGVWEAEAGLLDTSAGTCLLSAVVKIC